MSNKVKYFIDDKGRKCALFKGDKFIKEDTGYYRIATNWREDRPNSYRLHRAIMEDSLGRPLKRNEVIHHIDGDKENNDIENLEVLDNRKHSSYHAKNMNIVNKIKRSINIGKASKEAVKWHKTNPNSSKVHSKASKKEWKNRPYYKHICEQCGEEFYTREKKCKFCSGQCKNDYNLGYSLLEIESIEYIGKHDVYNMEVEKYHNYSIDGGMILHNCDSIRYFCNTIMKKRILHRM